MRVDTAAGTHRGTTRIDQTLGHFDGVGEPRQGWVQLGCVTASDPTGLRPDPRWTAAPDDSDQRWEHHGVVLGVDSGQRLEVAGHRPLAHARRRLGPGVDDVEAGVADQGGEEGADVGVAGIGHGQW